MAERDVFLFLLTPIGLYFGAGALLCYRLKRASTLTIGQWLLLGTALLVGFGTVVALVGFYFMVTHPMDPPEPSFSQVSVSNAIACLDAPTYSSRVVRLRPAQ